MPAQAGIHPQGLFSLWTLDLRYGKKMPMRGTRLLPPLLPLNPWTSPLVLGGTSRNRWTMPS